MNRKELQNLNVHVCHVCVTMSLINKIHPSCGTANWFPFSTNNNADMSIRNMKKTANKESNMRPSATTTTCCWICGCSVKRPTQISNWVATEWQHGSSGWNLYCSRVHHCSCGRVWPPLVQQKYAMNNWHFQGATNLGCHHTRDDG